MTGPRSEDGFFTALIEDGRPLLELTAIALLMSGGFAIFLAARREFLPHDIAFLGLDADQLCGLASCRIVGFMFHDRVAFGGTLIAIGTLYLWLTAFPLRAGERWAWNSLALSGIAGFASFLAYLGYGYLDTWHGTATLALLPCFLVGIIRSRALGVESVGGWLGSREAAAAPARLRIGRWCLVATGVGMIGAGATILVVGMTRVFVPQDLSFIGLTRDGLQQISGRLIPLIAHDRAGFGGGLLATGLLVATCAWYARPSRSFSQATTLAGLAGFGSAIGVHFAEGYTDATHLGPAVAGAALFLIAIGLEASGRR